MNALVPFVVIFCLSGTKEATSRRHYKAAHREAPVVKVDEVPKIQSQKDGGPGRTMIEVKNPLDEPIWVYIECPNTMTIVPIGIAGHTMSSVNLAFLGGKCLIHHWRVWLDGKRASALRGRESTPKKWAPLNETKRWR
jgi:hypothetical protein